MVKERNMKALNALVICLSFVATGSVTVPTGCSMFGYILNGIGSIHLPHLFPNISGSLSSLIGKRFFIDHPININWTNLFKNSEKVVLDSIKQTLPASKEISHTCRLNLKTTSVSNLDFIRAMSKIYKICVICDNFDTNTTTCDKIGFCPSTSVCYRGYSDDRKYWPTSPTYNIFDAMHPKGVFHGCCDPKDAKCLRNRYRVKNINNKVLAAANYTLHRCSSTACNGDDRSAITNFIHKIERVDGNWASWGKWGQCTHNCGTGTRTRHRTCTNPAPASGGKRCTGSSSSSSSCPNLPPCPVDGKWSTWHAWGSCSVTCGDGKQTRTRSCTNPKPAHGGKDCVGNTSDSRQCGQPCIIDGHWSSWGHWGHCQVTCGTGTKSRHRSCTNPAPSNGGKSCAGSSATTTVCSIAVACPVDGHWTSWGHWNNCPVTCGSGTRTRHRSCTNPTPAHGGKTCAGVSSATKQCVNPTSCPVDGHWASWGHWGHCSATCGLGTKIRHRTCSNPAPSAGGQSCTGSTDSSTPCSDLPSCPVDGKWSTWQAWGTCSVTCGDGKQTRTRTCTNPKPAHGGHACVGDASVSRHCGQPCIVDGHWSSWERWGSCSATCGSGTKTRHRSCTNPAPAHGGKSCSGGSSSTTSCTAPSQCPVDGHWNTWGAWGSCSVTCGDGQATRARSCTNPAPAHGGKTCVGDATVSRNCGQPCIIDGGWSNWQHWSKCSKSCSAGTRSRGRTCSNPSPANGGKDCVGHTSATEACDSGPCPEWTHWFYDACSVTCGSGTTMRVRHCSSGKDSDCGIGKAVETVKCNGGLCPIDGSWGTWKEWSRCTATCGTGQHTRSRSCDDPSPQNGGADCSGPAKETTACTVTDCPHWLPFEATSSCSVTCGKGFMQMKRNCSTGTQSDCDGSAFDEKTCILDECV